MKSIKNENRAQSKQNELQELKIHCEYCCNYLCFATETPCGHTFCEECIEQYLLFISECPVCQLQLRDKCRFRNIALDNIVYDYIETADKKELESYKQRTKTYKDFKNVSKIPTLMNGMRIDVRDNNGIWTVGIVNDKDIQQFYVRIQSVHNGAFDFFAKNENRLAALGSYTNRMEIPHYQNNKIVFRNHGALFQLVEWQKGSQKTVMTEQIQ